MGRSSRTIIETTKKLTHFAHHIKFTNFVQYTVSLLICLQNTDQHTIQLPVLAKLTCSCTSSLVCVVHALKQDGVFTKSLLSECKALVCVSSNNLIRLHGLQILCGHKWTVLSRWSQRGIIRSKNQSQPWPSCTKCPGKWHFGQKIWCERWLGAAWGHSNTGFPPDISTLNLLFALKTWFNWSISP